MRHRVDPLAALLVRARRPGRSSGRSATAGLGRALRGGCGMISSWVTDAAPCRCAVPRQSAPVSPPPMMTTCLPAAVIGDGRVALRPGWPAAGTPSPGGCRRARGPAPAGRAATVRADGEHDRVVARPQLRRRDVDADVDAGAEPRALGPHLLEPPVEVALLHLELGDAVAQQAADAVGPLVDRHGVPGPGQLLGGGEAGRAGADDGDGLARQRRGGCGHDASPSSQARSMIATSTCLMVTGSALMPSTQAVSHGAGHSRPVNSGKLLVACSRSIASRPVLAADQVVPLRDQVAQRAAVVAERDAAVHAAAGLLLRPLAGRTARRPRSSPAAARRPAAAAGSRRAVFKNPLGSAMMRPPSLVRRAHHGLVDVPALALGGGRRGQHPLVVAAA